MGVDKEPHAYAIDNKASVSTFEETALIFKQNERHLLYFRVTEEDFRNSYKRYVFSCPQSGISVDYVLRWNSFQIEFIKSKQDELITKELIRSRQLDQSVLRFTRIYQVGKSDFHRDDLSAAYSSEMTEGKERCCSR